MTMNNTFKRVFFHDHDAYALCVIPYSSSVHVCTGPSHLCTHVPCTADASAACVRVRSSSLSIQIRSEFLGIDRISSYEIVRNFDTSNDL
jgi:hypothetical protein